MFTTTRQYENGYDYRQFKLENYCLDYTETGSDILFVTFNSMLMGDDDIELRYPWGAKFLMENGYDVLGVKALYSHWYRDEELHDVFESDDLSELYQKYKRVIFYGNSMGAYAALAFSSTCPDAEILCAAPQTSFRNDVIHWDKRFDEWGARDQSWEGRFSDAAECIQNAKAVTVLYDPLCQEDWKHVKRLNHKNLTLLKVPFMGHEVFKHLSTLNLIKPIIHHYFAGDLSTWFPQAIRTRKSLRIYKSNLYCELAHRAIRRKDIDLAMAKVEVALKLNIKNEKAREMARLLIQRKKALLGQK